MVSDRESMTRIGMRPSMPSAAVRAAWNVADTPGREGHAQHAVAAVVGRRLEGLLEGAGRRCGCLGQHRALGTAGPELGRGQPDTVNELLLAEADGEGDDGEVAAVGQFRGEVTGAIGHHPIRAIVLLLVAVRPVGHRLQAGLRRPQRSGRGVCHGTLSARCPM
jgi:hypothetical protein